MKINLILFLILTSAPALAEPFAFADRAPAVMAGNPIENDSYQLRRTLDLAFEVSKNRELSSRETNHIVSALGNFRFSFPDSSYLEKKQLYFGLDKHSFVDINASEIPAMAKVEARVWLLMQYIGGRFEEHSMWNEAMTTAEIRWDRGEKISLLRNPASEKLIQYRGKDYNNRQRFPELAALPESFSLSRLNFNSHQKLQVTVCCGEKTVFELTYQPLKEELFAPTAALKAELVHSAAKIQAHGATPFILTEIQDSLYPKLKDLNDQVGKQ